MFTCGNESLPAHIFLHSPVRGAYFQLSFHQGLLPIPNLPHRKGVQNFLPGYPFQSLFVTWRKSLDLARLHSVASSPGPHTPRWCCRQRTWVLSPREAAIHPLKATKLCLGLSSTGTILWTELTGWILQGHRTYQSKGKLRHSQSKNRPPLNHG